MTGDQRVSSSFLIEVIFLGALAVFLLLRLKSVLGRRTGNEQERPNPLVTRGDESGADGRVVPLPDRRRPDLDLEEVGAERSGRRSSAAEGLARIRRGDPSFNERNFVAGARAAFQMIVEAFAAGDTASLRPLLGDDLYDAFSDAVRERLQRKETMETRVVDIARAEIEDAWMEGNSAFVSVAFASRQIVVTRNADGDVVDGSPDREIELQDIWTFTRNVRSPDPNWMLVETRTPG